MSNPKISVIMPVYKVEDYVGKAIESIQNQTLSDFEFLIVDDGTPDKSGEICDAYAKEDDRLIVIHQKNGGAPSARNAAIRQAKGEYLYFMDSDDWAEPQMLEDMYQLAKENSSQLVIAGFYIDTYYAPEKYITNDFVARDEVYKTAKEFREGAYTLFDHNLLYSPWNKLFETAYIREHQLEFPMTFWDDFPFILSVIRDIERVSVTSKQYYHFIRARAESETAAYRPDMYEKREEEHNWMIDIYRHWEVFDYTSKEMIARRYVERFIGCVENLTNPNCTMTLRQKRKKVKEMLSKKHVRECVRIMVPRSTYMGFMVLPVKWRNVTLLLLEAKIISFVKTKNMKMFASLKAGR